MTGPPAAGAPAPIAVSQAGQDRAGRRSEVREAAEAFEALLLQRLIHTMVEGQLKGGFFGGGAGASTYEALFERHLAEHLSARSPLGLAERLEEVWLRQGLDGYREALDAAETGVLDSVIPGTGLKNPGPAPIPNHEGPQRGPGDDR